MPEEFIPHVFMSEMFLPDLFLPHMFLIVDVYYIGESRGCIVGGLEGDFGFSCL